MRWSQPKDVHTHKSLHRQTCKMYAEGCHMRLDTARHLNNVICFYHLSCSPRNEFHFLLIPKTPRALNFMQKVAVTSMANGKA